MNIPVRIDAAEVYRAVTQSKAILVCAYDSDEKYEKYKLENSVSLSKFESLLPGLPKTQEIIFYCA